MGSLGSHVSSLRNGLREADFTISVSANGNSSDPVGAFPHAADVESDRGIRDREEARANALSRLLTMSSSRRPHGEITAGIAFRRARVIRKVQQADRRLANRLMIYG